MADTMTLLVWAIWFAVVFAMGFVAGALWFSLPWKD